MENKLLKIKTKLCKYYSKGLCNKNDNCTFLHNNIVNNEEIVKETQKEKKNKNTKIKKNTECFKPINKNEVDMQLIFHNADLNNTFNENITSKGVIIIDNLFKDFNNLEIYNKLVSEIEFCESIKPNLLKLWHGNDKIDGTHYIADDKLKWKDSSPTFNLIIDRLTKYFKMNVQATRFNWYKNTSQWKPYHFDASSIKPEKANIQNFTLAASFGTTREVSFERDTRDKIKIRFPLKDGQCYAFCKDTNILWRHGILQEENIIEEGRISIILWGWVEY